MKLKKMELDAVVEAFEGFVKLPGLSLKEHARLYNAAKVARDARSERENLRIQLVNAHKPEDAPQLLPEHDTWPDFVRKYEELFGEEIDLDFGPPLRLREDFTVGEAGAHLHILADIGVVALGDDDA